MTTFSSTTGKRDGDDDDAKKDDNADPLQSPNIGAVGGDYSTPNDTPIPGQDDHPDSSRL